MSGFPILSVMLLVPLLGALGCFFASASTARTIALVATLVNFALGVLLWANYDIGGAQWQFTERASLFAGFQWALGIDGIALMLIMLTVFLMPICILASASIEKRVGEYMAAFMVMEVLMIGTFAAQDLFLFYIMFEAGLIPMYLIIGVWGGADRIYASYKFFLYTLLGSVLMFIAMLWMANTAGTTYIPTLMAYDFAPQAQTWLWLAFFASFAVKMPMWPVHTWLPAAHVQAPTAGSVILAGVLLKLGGYGFVRFSLPMFPDASAQFMWLVFALSMAAVVVTSLIALVQHDMKKLIAYSSVAHMAIVTVGLFAFNVQGLEGAMIVMLSHGLVAGALFLCVGVIYDRLHTREIDRYGGLSINMPKYALFFLLFTMASIGLPGTSGFVGEFLSLGGIYQVSSWVALVCTTGIILGAAYMLYLYRRIAFGVQTNADAAAMPDLSVREWLMLGPIAAAVLWMGVYPESFMAPMRADIALLNERLAAAKPAGDAMVEAGRGEPVATGDAAAQPAPEGSTLMDYLYSLGLVIPELVLTLSGLIMLLFAAWGGAAASRAVSIACCVALGGAFALVAPSVCGGASGLDTLAFGGQVRADAFAGFAKLMIYAAAGATLVIAPRYFERLNAMRPEFPVLVLFAALGMSVMVSASDLLALYIGLELNSLAAYVLAAYLRDDDKSAEAGLKYFVLGALASGILLFGMSLLYGFTGSTAFDAINVAMSDGLSGGELFGLIFVMAGMAFKISAVPFHMWTPDVYEGAPTPVTMFFASAPKVAAVALLTRISLEAFGSQAAAWQQIVTFTAIASIVVGALGAIGQENIKRLLAFSSINNVGFILVGLATATAAGASSMLVYLVFYVAMTIGSFVALLMLRDADGNALETFGDIKGLSTTRPALAWCLLAIMFSLAGIPPLMGFYSKLVVFQAAVQANLLPLAAIGIAASVIGAFYYLKFIKVMFFDEPVDRVKDTGDWAHWALLGLSVLVISPLAWLATGWIGNLADMAAASLFIAG